MEVLQILGVRNLKEGIEECPLSEFPEAIQTGELLHHLPLIPAVPKDGEVVYVRRARNSLLFSDELTFIM